MGYSVITIARTLGADGEAIGRLVAAESGMRYVDDEIIGEAALRAGVTAEEMARTEVRKGLIERIFESFANTGVGAGVPATEALGKMPGYEQLIVEVIRQTAAAGNAVIVAHGAAFALADARDTLRVLVTASVQTRVARLVAAGQGKPAAGKMIEDSDAARADFLRRFYKAEYEDATHYDLVVNTDYLGAAKAATLLRGMARHG